MDLHLSQLQYKEVIGVSQGQRFGYLREVELDADTGRITALVLPGRRRWFGLLGREPDRRFPWRAVRRFGADMILVDDALPVEDTAQSS